MPDDACAILVKEDFLDAPLGTSCLLLDSLYVAVASPAGTGSSVLILHVRPALAFSHCCCCVHEQFRSAGHVLDTPRSCAAYIPVLTPMQ